MITPAHEYSPDWAGSETSGPEAGIGQALSELYSSVVGHEESLTKLPLVVARDMEERFLRDGWTVGRAYGGEAAMAAYYGVGRDVMREALRVLEARDEIRVRRGPGGGVTLAKPCRTHLRVMIGGYAYLNGVCLTEIVEAWCAVHVAAVHVLGHRSSLQGEGSRAEGARDLAGGLQLFAAGLVERTGGLLSYLSELLAPLLPLPAPGYADGPLAAQQREILRDIEQGRTDEAVRRARALFRSVAPQILAQAERSGSWPGLTVPEPVDRIRVPAFAVVRRMMSEIEPGEWVAGRLLGNEFELAERYNADRSVVRQAIRIMEDAETAVMRPGRGRGLTTRRPGSAPLSRQLCVHLAAHLEPLEDTDLAVRGLLIEMAEIAARKVGPSDFGLLGTLVDSLHHLAMTEPISSIQPIERMQNRLAHNALLSLFVDGAKAYLSWSMGEELYAPAWLLELYARSTHGVIQAISRADAQEAARLQAVKLDVLERCRSAVVSGRKAGIPREV